MDPSVNTQLHWEKWNIHQAHSDEKLFVQSSVVGKIYRRGWFQSYNYGKILATLGIKTDMGIEIHQSEGEAELALYFKHQTASGIQQEDQ